MLCAGNKTMKLYVMAGSGGGDRGRGPAPAARALRKAQPATGCGRSDKTRRQVVEAEAAEEAGFGGPRSLEIDLENSLPTLPPGP